MSWKRSSVGIGPCEGCWEAADLGLQGSGSSTTSPVTLRQGVRVQEKSWVGVRGRDGDLNPRAAFWGVPVVKAP